MSIHIVEQLLVVVELIVPFVGKIITEVITEWHQQDVILEQLSLLSVLVQQHLGSVLQQFHTQTHSKYRAVVK